MTVKLYLDKAVGFPTHAKVWTEDIENEAYEQIKNLSRMPFIHHHIAVMPDVHYGNGTSVGTVIPTIKAIIPAAVGVDIGCGMMAVQLPMRADMLPDNLSAMRSAIEAAVPHGRTDEGGVNDRGAWGTVPDNVYNAFVNSLYDFGRRIVERAPGVKKSFDRAANQLGTLGTGNHFIEVCTDLYDGVWVMLHSGSRGIGNKIGQTFIDKAKLEMERWHIHLPDKNLAYLPEGSEYFDDYWQALAWAQDYARLNRELMMDATLTAISGIMGFDVHHTEKSAINCHHNYVSLENHYGRNIYVTRKGAVRARAGDLGIIPGSMGARSFIVRGLGNPESFCSCSHGAGRSMSRGEARRRFSVADLQEQTAGVECRKDEDVIDEIPSAYKDIQKVMDNQSDLVEVVAELKQVLCVKG